jgi:uncharacterized membrane protein
MDAATIAATLFMFTLAGVAVYAKKIGNEKRDVAALGVSAGLCGLGAVAAYPTNGSSPSPGPKNTNTDKGLR